MVERFRDLQVFCLDPCDLFLCGYVKDQGHWELARITPDLKTKINNAIESITEEKLQKMFKNLENRLLFLILQNALLCNFIEEMNNYDVKLENASKSISNELLFKEILKLQIDIFSTPCKRSSILTVESNVLSLFVYSWLVIC